MLNMAMLHGTQLQAAYNQERLIYNELKAKKNIDLFLDDFPHLPIAVCDKIAERLAEHSVKATKAALAELTHEVKGGNHEVVDED